MSFGVSNTNIANYRRVQGLLGHSDPGPNSAITYEFPSSGMTGFISGEQLSAGTNILLVNADGNTLQFPPYTEMKYLFNNLVQGSTREWNLTLKEPSDSFTIQVPNSSSVDQQNLSGAGFYKIALNAMTGPIGANADFEYDLHYSQYNGSVVMPVPLVQTITASPATIAWNLLNTGSGYPPSIVIKSTVGGPAVLYLGNALSLWNKLFGASRMPAAGTVYYGDIMVINDTGATLNITTTVGGGIMLLTGGFSLLTKQVAQFKVKFTSKTNTSATAQLQSTVLEFTA